MFIVNAPWAFTAVWTIIKAFLDEVTKNKIQIMGGSFLKKLLEVVEEDQLADFLGGKNTARLQDNVGPWNDYEVVDGHLKDDIVGVRKISDGPEGKVFTPADYELLPNYLI
jgi:hypothetical protein